MTIPKARSGLVSLLLLAFAAAGCSSVDYQKAQDEIKEKLNEAYGGTPEVSGVACDEADSPKAGGSFICRADIGADDDVRVKVELVNDDFKASYSTLDIIFRPSEVEEYVSKWVLAEYDVEATTNCGHNDVFVVAIGDSFTCEVTDGRGDSEDVIVTAENVNGDVALELDK